MFDQIINRTLEALPILTAIFITVLSLIILARIIFYFLLSQAQKKYHAIKRVGQKIVARKKNLPKSDEELLRKKEDPQRDQAPKVSSYEIIPNEEEQQKDLNDTQIVDVVKPIGFFTAMILGQKLTYLIKSAQAINKRGDKGFWVSMVEAKDREAGRQHGRGGR